MKHGNNFLNVAQWDDLRKLNDMGDDVDQFSFSAGRVRERKANGPLIAIGLLGGVAAVTACLFLLNPYVPSQTVEPAVQTVVNQVRELSERGASGKRSLVANAGDSSFWKMFWYPDPGPEIMEKNLMSENSPTPLWIPSFALCWENEAPENKTVTVKGRARSITRRETAKPSIPMRAVQEEGTTDENQQIPLVITVKKAGRE